VMQFLISQGVKPSLLSAKGFGEADPVASNDTPTGRAQNRRVELTLAGSGQ
jgi:chemotaxis protein MotB